MALVGEAGVQGEIGEGGACKVLRIGFVTSLAILTRAVEKKLLTREEGMRFLEKLRSYGRFRNAVIEEVSRQIGGTAHGESSEDG